MTVQKESLPSLTLITSVLSIVFYCVGFIRLEVELHEQKNRINGLEGVALKANPLSDPPSDPNIQVPKNSPGESSLRRYKTGITHVLVTIKPCLEGTMRVRVISNEFKVCFCCDKCGVKRSSLTEKKLTIRMKTICSDKEQK